MLKQTYYNLINPVLIFIMYAFYRNEYLKGKYFENSYLGVIWCLRGLYWQKIMRINSNIPWPTSPFIRISDPENIEFHPDDLNNFQGFGNYYQNFAGKIVIGRGTYIAPNVGIITANHDPYNLDSHCEGKDVILGRSCWIGMNAVILPGVILGDHTIVGAGSVVTKSFPDGFCVIAGNPARVIKLLDRNKFH